jgi:predicted peptidase
MADPAHKALNAGGFDMKKICFWLLCLACVYINGCSEEAMKEPGQHAQFFEKEVVKKAQLDYWLYLPKDYGTPGKTFPLLMFLHGKGERGSDINQVLIHGPAKLAWEGKDFPFIVLSPQCPENDQWIYITDELVALYDHIADTYAVDKNRLYVTGLSMGGYGTWALIQRHPDKFAAAAPICGAGDKEVAKRRLKDLPIWVFHGTKDNVIPIEKSEEMVEALKQGGNKKVKFTVYPEAWHDSWTETYNNPELYEWFLKHTVN